MFNVSTMQTLQVVISTLRQEGVNPPVIETVFGAVADDEMMREVRRLKQRIADAKADILGPLIPGVDDRPDDEKGRKFIRSGTVVKAVNRPISADWEPRA